MKYQPPYGSPGTDDPYVNGDPSIARKGSILPAAAAEFPQREIVNFIDHSAMVPSDLDLEQLTKASRDQWVNFCVDSGAVNSLSVALTPALTEYKQGLPLRVLVGNNNTGATVINVNSLGSRPIKRANGAQLEEGDLMSGMIALLVDDGSVFQLVNYLGAISGITNNYAIHIPYAEDTSPTPNSIVAAYLPPITTIAPGDLVLVKVKNTNTGPVVILMNALAQQPVRRNDGKPLESGDLLKDECILIEYNTTYWQMLRLVKSQVYFKLTANLLLWVRTDGNDLNDGFSNTPERAFRTIQAAIDYVAHNFLIGGRMVTIRLGIPGTYGPKQVLIQNLAGSIIITGDSASPLSYVVLGSTTAVTPYANVIGISGSGTQVSLNGITISMNSPYHNIVECNYNATCHVSNVAFSGVATVGSCLASFGGTYTCNSYIDMYAPCGGFFGGYNAEITIGLWFTVIRVHGVTFSTFISAVYSYVAISAGWCTFSGAGYGYRYLGYYNSAIITGGGGEYYLPGNINGGVDSSSVYG